MRPNAIGIDIGTTSICGVVIDTKTGELLRSITKDSEAFLEGSAPWEKIQSVDKIIGIATDILDSLISEETQVIGVTGQMHGIVYVDDKGNHLSPLYTWQDGRGNQAFGDTTYADYLGCSSGYGHVTDFYNRHNKLVPRNAVSFCTIQDYFVMRLCGLTKPLVHSTDAASFGLFDLKERRFTCDSSIEIVDGYRLVGNYKNIPVSAAIGDNQASVLSSLSGGKEALINIGTGSQVSVICDKAEAGEQIEIRPYFEGKYLAVGAALCGGRAYAVLKDFYKSLLSMVTNVDDRTVYALMAELLRQEGKPLNVDTRFEGTRADKTLRGSIRDISTENFTPSALTKGVLEGMIKELHDLYRTMNVEISGIVGSGNGIRKNQALAETAERVFGCPIKIPCHTEEAAVGAALYGMLSAGICKDLSEAGNLIQYSN
ncbi:MAG: hypothetical protein IJP15_02500 [Oscillospiraceae bacterium]|nr:hypothetical protein [Oscillospiraceae bacterium]